MNAGFDRKRKLYNEAVEAYLEAVEELREQGERVEAYFEAVAAYHDDVEAFFRGVEGLHGDCLQVVRGLRDALPKEKNSCTELK